MMEISRKYKVGLAKYWTNELGCYERDDKDFYQILIREITRLRAEDNFIFNHKDVSWSMELFI